MNRVAPRHRLHVIGICLALLGASCSGNEPDPTVPTTVAPTTTSSTTVATTTAVPTTSTTEPARSNPLVTSFDALGRPRGFGLGPDEAIAAGEDRIVVITNQVISIRNKSGELIDEATTEDFFAPTDVDPAVKSSRRITDPHVTYDPESQRFFVVESAGRTGESCDIDPCPAYQLVGVSRDARPGSLGAADWYHFAFDRMVERTTDGPVAADVGGDLDLIAVGENAVVISSAHFDVDTWRPMGGNLRIIPKQPLLDGTPPDTWRDIAGITNPVSGDTGIKLHPIGLFDGSGRFVFVSPAGGCLTIDVWVLEDPLGAATLETHRLTGEPPMGCDGSSVDPDQPDDAPRLLGRSWPTGSVAGTSLWITEYVKVAYPSGDYSGVAWLEVDLSAWPAEPSIIQQGVLSSEGVHRFMPAGAASSDNGFALVYGQTGPNEYPSLYAAYRAAGDPLGELREPLLLQSGTAAYTFEPRPTFDGPRMQYADYYGAATDPVDGSIWLVGQYAVEGDGESPNRKVWAANIAPEVAGDASTAGADETGGGPEFSVGSEVSTEDDRAARDGIEAAITGVEDLSGHGTRDFRVHVHDSVETIAQAYCEYSATQPSGPGMFSLDCEQALEFWERQDALVDPRVIFVRTDHPTWTGGEGVATLTYEYILLLQMQLAGDVLLVSDGEDTPPGGPWWMREGQASYILTSLRLEQFPFAREQMEENAFLGDPNRPDLRDLESPQGWHAGGEYSGRYAQFAVYLIVDDFGAGVDDLLDFYALQGDEGMPWPDAFAAAFGVTIEEFYDHVEALG